MSKMHGIRQNVGKKNTDLQDQNSSNQLPVQAAIFALIIFRVLQSWMFFVPGIHAKKKCYSNELELPSNIYFTSHIYANPK